MKPIRTAKSNFVYGGPHDDIGDAWVEKSPEVVYMVWELDDDERRFIIDGGNLKLGIYYVQPIPPVSLGVTGEQKIEESGFRNLPHGPRPVESAVCTCQVGGYTDVCRVHPTQD
jgi:hypothetical protein